MAFTGSLSIRGQPKSLTEDAPTGLWDMKQRGTIRSGSPCPNQSVKKKSINKQIQISVNVLLSRATCSLVQLGLLSFALFCPKTFIWPQFLFAWMSEECLSIPAPLSAWLTLLRTCGYSLFVILIKWMHSLSSIVVKCQSLSMKSK